MAYRVGFFLPAEKDVCDVLRRHFAPDLELVTLRVAGEAELIEAVRTLDFLIAVRVTARMIENAPRLRLIQLPGVGYDQVDMPAVARAGIPLALSPTGSSEAVAEHTLLLMLAVSRRVVELCKSLRAGQWLMWNRRTCSHNLQGRTLGLVGCGRIGREVAKRAAAFCMQVQYCDPIPAGGFRFVPFEELLATSDIVSLHVPLTAETHHLIGSAQIGNMKPGAILINTARGGLVDEAALYDALISGHLHGAGLDVFEEEPPGRDNPLLQLPQVVATPHVATGTLESLEQKAALYAGNIRRVLAGAAPVGLLSQAIAVP
jgi:phosphoglycerate dehydrogenase-like enzyme